MELQTFLPSDVLKPYIKHYWIFATDQESMDGPLYPSGFLELAINISQGNVTTILDDRYITMPSVEVLGQLTAPGRITATKGTTLLVTRFYPHATSLFFPNRVVDFTNDSIDLADVFNADSAELYNRIMDQRTLRQKIHVLDTFLVRQLAKNKKEAGPLQLIASICNNAERSSDPPDIEDIAVQHGYSERYIQKLFLDYIGVTPKRFFNIQRFNKSLELVRSSTASLTSIAYECGYYDQAHFIKEFKAFTGITPSQFQQPAGIEKVTEE